MIVLFEVINLNTQRHIPKVHLWKLAYAKNCYKQF